MVSKPSRLFQGCWCQDVGRRLLSTKSTKFTRITNGFKKQIGCWLLEELEAVQRVQCYYHT
jgi:hypothetical protein